MKSQSIEEMHRTFSGIVSFMSCLIQTASAPQYLEERAVVGFLDLGCDRQPPGLDESVDGDVPLVSEHETARLHVFRGVELRSPGEEIQPPMFDQIELPV